jgi:hypothetical protein
MINAAILVLHGVAAIYVLFLYKKEGVGDGLLAVGFVVIIFAVGWTISTMISKIIYPATLAAAWIARLQQTHVERLMAKEITIDTFSLVLLTLGEVLFYYFYLKGENRGKEKQKNVT